jgi:hypothetical protein
MYKVSALGQQSAAQELKDAFIVTKFVAQDLLMFATPFLPSSEQVAHIASHSAKAG